MKPVGLPIVVPAPDAVAYSAATGRAALRSKSARRPVASPPDAPAEVSDAQTPARHALEMGLPRDGAVQHGVADDDVLGRIAFCFLGLAHDPAPAGEALADIVVGIADKIKRPPT